MVHFQNSVLISQQNDQKNTFIFKHFSIFSVVLVQYTKAQSIISIKNKKKSKSFMPFHNMIKYYCTKSSENVLL